MRHIALFMAGAAALCLLPAVAAADPVTAAIAGALGAGTIGTALIGFGVNLAVSYALSSLTSGGAPSATGGMVLANVIDPLAVVEVVYGRVRKGGPITYVEGFGETNRNLNLIVALAGHQVDAIETIYLNDTPVTLDANGYVADGPFAGMVRIFRFLGGAAQEGPAGLIADSALLDENFRGRGIAYLSVRLIYDADVFAGGIPVITAVVRGRKVFDPRTGLTQWSANAALCIRDYLTSADGLGDPAVDDVSFAAMANICDEVIALPDATTEARYEINGIVALDREPGDVLADMTKSCAGQLWYGPAGWQLKVGHYPGLAGALGLDDLRGEIEINPRAEIDASFNQVQGAFADALQAWVEVDYPLVSDPAWLAEDAGEVSLLRHDLPFTTSAHAAQRLAALALHRSREQIAFSADFGMAAFALTVGDVVPVTIARYGWTAKPFEILRWAFVPGFEPKVRLDLQEVSAEVYSAAPSTTAIAGNNTILPDWHAVAPVSVVVASELRIVNEQVAGVLVITVTPGTGYVDYYEAQYRASGTTAWKALGQSSEGLFEALDIVDGLYDVRAWAVSPFGTKGAVTELLAIEAKPFAPRPADVTGFAGNIVGESLFLTWDAVSDLDLSHYRIRWSAETVGASYQKAVDLVRKVARPATSVQVPAQTGTYFIKAVDKIGGASVNPGSIVVLDDAGDVLPRNVIATIPEHPAYAGAKAGVARTTDDTGAYLVLDTTSLFDSHSGLFDDAEGLFDGGLGDLQQSGTYDFATVFDLGYRATCRIAAVLDLDLKDYTTSFDGTPGLFDDAEGLFDGDPAAMDRTTVVVLVSTTDDDPSGTPVWSAWRAFTRSTITARAARFRLELRSQVSVVSPIIRGATVAVDMPDRIESADDLAFTGSRVVVFDYPFAVAPAVSVSVVLANGDRYEIGTKTRNGFVITAYTGAAVSTNPASFDYVAKGYGKELP